MTFLLQLQLENAAHLTVRVCCVCANCVLQELHCERTEFRGIHYSHLRNCACFISTNKAAGSSLTLGHSPIARIPASCNFFCPTVEHRPTEICWKCEWEGEILLSNLFSLSPIWQLGDYVPLHGIPCCELLKQSCLGRVCPPVLNLVCLNKLCHSTMPLALGVVWIRTRAFVAF